MIRQSNDSFILNDWVYLGYDLKLFYWISIDPNSFIWEIFCKCFKSLFIPCSNIFSLLFSFMKRLQLALIFFWDFMISGVEIRDFLMTDFWVYRLLIPFEAVCWYFFFIWKKVSRENDLFVEFWWWIFCYLVTLIIFKLQKNFSSQYHW